MAIEVKKKERENTRSLLRRFTRRIQQSGILVRARKARFWEKEQSKTERRQSALRRQRAGRKIEKLKKLGLFEEDRKFKKRR